MYEIFHSIINTVNIDRANRGEFKGKLLSIFFSKNFGFIFISIDSSIKINKKGVKALLLYYYGNYS